MMKVQPKVEQGTWSRGEPGNQDGPDSVSSMGAAGWPLTCIRWSLAAGCPRLGKVLGSVSVSGDPSAAKPPSSGENPYSGPLRHGGVGLGATEDLPESRLERHTGVLTDASGGSGGWGV